MVPGRGDDDLYVIYTGGTTGMPKGVVWRMGDAFFGCIGGGDPMRLSGPVTSPAETLDRIIDFDFVFYALAPLMHAAAQWVSFMWFLCGAKVVLHTGPFDPGVVWRTIESEHVTTTTVVGDAMARPLCDDWDAQRPLRGRLAVRVLQRRRTARRPPPRPGSRRCCPTPSSPTGSDPPRPASRAASGWSPGADAGSVTRFDNVMEGTKVLTDGGDEVEPGSGVVGQVAHTGYIPLRYHNAPEKTAETFVELDGRRYVLSGDMATVEADGSIILLGRGSVSINTGGEKVYPEEVEGVLKGHPAVYDVLVVGVPHERWGEQVTAVVHVTEGASSPSTTWSSTVGASWRATSCRGRW